MLIAVGLAVGAALGAQIGDARRIHVLRKGFRGVAAGVAVKMWRWLMQEPRWTYQRPVTDVRYPYWSLYRLTAHVRMPRIDRAEQRSDS